MPQSARPPAEGDVVDGLRLTRFLGGNLGRVFAARDVATGREVAVKFVGGAEEDRVDRLTDLIGLRHERIVPVERIGAHAGLPFLVMPRVTGGDLAAGIGRYSAAPAHCLTAELTARLDAIARLVAETADGVAFLHRYGVIHRDIKPGNILLGPDGPLLCDFGLLRWVTDPLNPTVAGLRVGSAAYMAPEQAAGRPVSTRADVWSLGAVLYELLVGHPPHCPPGVTDSEFVRAKDGYGPPPPPSRLNPLLPSDADLEWLCMQCLQHNPDDRLAAADLAERLRRILARESVRDGETWVQWVGRILPLPWFGQRPPRGEWHYPERWKGPLRIEATTSFLAHAGLFALSLLAAPGWALCLWFLAADFSAGWLIWAPARRRHLLTPMERAVGQWWTGADMAMLGLFWAFVPILSPVDPVDVGRFYAAAAAVRGLIFWIEGATWWGRLHVVGLLFIAAAAVIPFVTPAGPLVHAVLYSASFVWLSRQKWTDFDPTK